MIIFSIELYFEIRDMKKRLLARMIFLHATDCLRYICLLLLQSTFLAILKWLWTLIRLDFVCSIETVHFCHDRTFFADTSARFVCDAAKLLEVCHGFFRLCLNDDRFLCLTSMINEHPQLAYWILSKNSFSHDFFFEIFEIFEIFEMIILQLISGQILFILVLKNLNQLRTGIQGSERKKKLVQNI